MTRGAQVQDGESAKPEPHLVIEVQARIVGAAVSDALGHAAEYGRVGLSTVETEHDSKTAHSLTDLAVFVGEQSHDQCPPCKAGAHRPDDEAPATGASPDW